MQRVQLNLPTLPGILVGVAHFRIDVDRDIANELGLTVGGVAGTVRPVLAGQDVTLGRVSFGPRFTKTFDLNGGAEITPSLNLQGSWDFDQTAFIDVNSGALNTPDELRARFEGVVTARVSEEREFVIDTFYDGIGNSGWSAFGLKLGMKVMLK